jgi:hypothetical protein
LTGEAPINSIGNTYSQPPVSERLGAEVTALDWELTAIVLDNITAHTECTGEHVMTTVKALTRFVR